MTQITLIKLSMRPKHDGTFFLTSTSQRVVKRTRGERNVSYILRNSSADCFSTTDDGSDTAENSFSGRPNKRPEKSQSGRGFRHNDSELGLICHDCQHQFTNSSLLLMNNQLHIPSLPNNADT